MAQAIRRPSNGRPVAERRHITRSDLSNHPRRFRGRHHAATIFVVLLLAVFGFRFFPERDVTVLTNGRAYRVQATFDPASEGLAAADVRLAPGDRVVSASGGNHSSVAVQRARDVTVQVDGQTVAVRTQATTVGGALADAGLDLHGGDRIYLEGALTTERGPLSAAYAAQIQNGVIPGSNGALPDLHLRIVRARPATVIVDTLPVQLSSPADTVQGLLADLGMTVREGDLVRPSLDTPLTAGMVVRLAKARTVTVKLDGKEQSLYTLAANVGDILRLLNVDPSTVDEMSFAVDAPVYNGMAINISRTITTEEESQEAILPATVYEDDPNMASGKVTVVNGTPGIRTHKYQVTYKNGQEVERVEVGSPVVAQVATPNRQIRGTKPVALAASKPTLDAPGYNGPYSRKVSVYATWYNAQGGAWSRDDPNYGRTATGAIVDYGICAVDPSFIPLHTRFFVPGYGMCVAADTGGAINGNKIDLGFPESAGDPGWGTRTVDIYIVD